MLSLLILYNLRIELIAVALTVNLLDRFTFYYQFPDHYLPQKPIPVNLYR